MLCQKYKGQTKDISTTLILIEAHINWNCYLSSTHLSYAISGIRYKKKLASSR